MSHFIHKSKNWTFSATLILLSIMTIMLITIATAEAGYHQAGGNQSTDNNSIGSGATHSTTGTGADKRDVYTNSDGSVATRSVDSGGNSDSGSSYSGGVYTPPPPPPPPPCTTYPNLQVTAIHFRIPRVVATTTVSSTPVNSNRSFSGTFDRSGMIENQNNLTMGAQYQPEVVITNSGCTNTSAGGSHTSAPSGGFHTVDQQAAPRGGIINTINRAASSLRSSFGGQLWRAFMGEAEASGGPRSTPNTSSKTTDGRQYHIDQLPFGQNGTFPVRLQIDFQNDTSFEITEYINNQGPLAPGAQIIVRFPVITVEGGTHSISGTVDVTAVEAPNYGCSGAEGCVIEQGTPAGNTLTELFTAIVPSVQIGSYLLSGPNTIMIFTNLYRSIRYGTIDKRFTDRDLASDTSWMKQIGNDLYTNVGLYWTGTRVRLSTCTGTTIKNDGTTLTDFNGKIDIPPSPASGNLSYYSGTTITGFPGTGQNLDLQIIEPEASTSHLYTITCQTFSGGTVSDSILISNGLGNICGAGLVWDGLTCVASGVNSLQGSDCTIPANQSSCNASFSWDLYGVLSPQVRNTTTNVTYPNANRVVTNAMHSIIYGPNIIQSRDGSTVLREITVTGRCVASAPWDSSRKVCYSAPSVPPTPGTISVTVESAVVRKLDTTTVNWQISNPIPLGYACTLNGPGLVNITITEQTGSQITQPIDNTSVFTVICTNGTTPVSGKATVEIIPEVQEV